MIKDSLETYNYRASLASDGVEAILQGEATPTSIYVVDAATWVNRR